MSAHQGSLSQLFADPIAATALSAAADAFQRKRDQIAAILSCTKDTDHRRYLQGQFEALFMVVSDLRFQAGQRGFDGEVA